MPACPGGAGGGRGPAAWRAPRHHCPGAATATAEIAAAAVAASAAPAATPLLARRARNALGTAT
jgi:hypothetical protein